jgi:hypothetical protein
MLETDAIGRLSRNVEGVAYRIDAGRVFTAPVVLSLSDERAKPQFAFRDEKSKSPAGLGRRTSG